MKDLILGRREFIRLSSLGTCFVLSGCQTNLPGPVLTSYPGILPKEFLKKLPSTWSFKLLQKKPGDNPFRSQFRKSFDLLAIGDGWLEGLDMESFSLIGGDRNTRLSLQTIQGKEFLNSFESEISTRILPIGCSPWCILLRKGESLLSKAKETWQVLLEQDLKGELILPKSARIVMELSERIGGIEELRKLRLQAKAFDDRNAINWVVSGKAKAAVMPLQNCMSKLLTDPRLKIAIPSEGVPLNWTILLRANTSTQSLPFSWINETLKPPLLNKLLLDGWIPMINFSELFKKAQNFPEPSRSIYNYSEKAFNNAWSLAPLSDLQQRDLEKRWLDSSP